MNLFLNITTKIELDKIKNILLKNKNINTFYSFTPYSSYVYDKLGIKYISLSEYYTACEYKEETQRIKQLFFKENDYLTYYKYKFTLLISEIIQDNVKYKLIKDDTYIYITDTKSNIFFNYLDQNNIVILEKNSPQKIRRYFKFIYFFKFIEKLKNILSNFIFHKFHIVNSSYDMLYFNLFPKITVKQFLNKIKFHQIANKNKVKNIFKEDVYPLILAYNNVILNEVAKIYSNKLNIVDIDILQQNSFCFSCLGSSLVEYELKRDAFNANQNVITYQHGSYFYHTAKGKYFEDMFETEIRYSNVNFVFNDYTKKLFEDLGAKRVYSVGSILFNKPIKKRKKEYDFLYITQGHDYTGDICYVDFINSLHSFDGYELYQRHKNIIELFGTKFKDKKILIRVHPCVVTTGVYVPFWELSEQYPNITIDVSIPIHTLIEKSKYIISDYFTTEFINRELHYKRDIILFQGAPTPLPEETFEDMKKMFILIDTVDDLEDKVKNIEEIAKNRKRYDDIIEYYSSKKCDTKKVVTNILEKEFDRVLKEN